MDSSASIVRSGEISRHIPTSPPPSKLKTYGFVIAIIVGIGGLAVGAAGLAGYFYVGALSNMAQIDAIIMMAAGGGGGIILLIVGVVGTVKTGQSSSHRQHGGVHVDSERGGATRKSCSTGRAEIIRSIDTKGGLVYGPEAWKIWNVKVLDVVPPAPQVDLSKKDKVLLYIPQRARVDGKEQNLTLKALKEISGVPVRYFNKSVEEQFGDNMATPGWVLIDKNVILESLNKDYETQKRMVEERGCSMPSVLEAVVLNLMVFAFTGERVYGQKPWTFTRCIEKVDGQYPVVVGGFGSDCLSVFISTFFENGLFGAACVLRKF